MPHQIERRKFLTVSAGCLMLPMLAQLSGCNGNGQPEPERKVFSDPKFELLDLALQHEFGAVVQYGNHAGVIEAIGRDVDGSIQDIIQDIVNQEIHHAILLTTILKKNNIEPTVAMWPPQTAPTAGEMIRKDIAAESGAVKLYQQILTLDFDDETKKIIENIMRSEKVHRTMFTAILPELS